MTKKEAFGYRVGAVQTMDGFGEPTLLELALFKRKTIKKAIKQLKNDYPKQNARVDKFYQNGRVYLAIQPERPNPPDQWMIVGQEIRNG